MLGADWRLRSYVAAKLWLQHPAPGTQLGESSEGRSFVTDGQEIWAVNGYQHDVTIITGVESAAGHPVAALNRADRGYYHYMANVTGISFNKVSGSGRRANRDTFGYFATCQDSENTYTGLKQPNFFMGPSLYDSRPVYKNLVGQDGGPCEDGDKCFWLHADMLHESPDCAGIVHDPEILTAHGTVYWAIDGWNGELVRYDFQQPHGPALMEHSAAAVRRYPDVRITRGPPGVISGMVLDDSRRTLYLSDVGSGRIIAVKIDTGVESRDARTEYTIFSSMVPQFEYTIWQCAETSDLETTFSTPAGLALTADSSRLFVAEHYTNMIYALELPSGRKIAEIDLLVPGGGLSALAISPHSGALFFSNQNTNEIVRIEPQACNMPAVPIEAPGFDWGTADMALATGPTCTVNDTLPDLALFQQVHGDSGYSDADQSVQNNSMWAGAALLANRFDCAPDSALNNDALLLGGYFCHRCLPDPCAEYGGYCANIWWKGYSCSNKRYLELDAQGAFTLSPAASVIANGVDHPVPELAADLNLAAGRYHIVVNATDHQIYVAAQCGEAGADAARSTGHLVDGHGMLSFTVDANASSSLRYCSSVAGSLDQAITLDPGAADPTMAPTDQVATATTTAMEAADTTPVPQCYRQAQPHWYDCPPTPTEASGAAGGGPSSSDDDETLTIAVAVLAAFLVLAIGVVVYLITSQPAQPTNPPTVVSGVAASQFAGQRYGPALDQQRSPDKFLTLEQSAI